MAVEQSSEVKDLFAALLAFSIDAEQPIKNATNAHFGNTFADLRTVLATIKPTLIRHGLVITQLPAATEKGIGLCTMICHAATGQWLRATVAMPVQQNTPQAAASAVTYARRYGLMAILNLAAEDDDAEAAMGRDTRMQQHRTRDGSPIVVMNNEKPARGESTPDNDQRTMTRSAARAAVRRANATVGGMRTMDDIAGAPPSREPPQAPVQAPAPAPAQKPAQPRSVASVTPLRKGRVVPSMPNAGRPVVNPRAVTGYNEMANTVHSMTPVKITGELDDYGLLMPPGSAPRFTSGPNEGRAYTEVLIDVLRDMASARNFQSAASPLQKLWVAYLVARIDAQTRVAL